MSLLKSDQHKYKLWRGAGLGLVCALIAWVCCSLGPLRSFDRLAFDELMALRGARTSESKSQIVIIDVGFESQLAINKPEVYISPELARAIDYLKPPGDHGAAAIGIDLFIPDTLRDLPGLKTDEGSAKELGLAIKRSGNVVLPIMYLDNIDDRNDPKWQLPLEEWRLKQLIEGSTDGLAFVNLTEDADHFVRRQLLWTSEVGSDQGPTLHFALALLKAAGKQIDFVGSDALIDGHHIQLDQDGKLVINFVGPNDPFEVISLKQLLDDSNRPPSDRFAGKVVLIGAVGNVCDLHVTPFSNRLFRSESARSNGLMSGTELHAHILATLLDKSYLRSLPRSAGVLLISLIGAFLGAIFSWLRWGWALIVALSFYFVWKYVCYILLSQANFQLELGTVLLTTMLAFGTSFALRWRHVQRLLRSTCSSPVALLLENTDRLNVPGRERIVTVLFADIRGFTTWSKDQSAEKVFGLLNAYFADVVPIIQNHGGVLTQYMGDGLMAVFGAPADDSKHALHAVQAANYMVRCVRRNKRRWAALEFEHLRIGVGVNSGTTAVGTLGIPTRLDYSAVGAVTNAASRIEAANKLLQSDVLIGKSTFNYLTPEERLAMGCHSQQRRIDLSVDRADEPELWVHELIVPIEPVGKGD